MNKREKKMVEILWDLADDALTYAVQNCYCDIGNNYNVRHHSHKSGPCNYLDAHKKYKKARKIRTKLEEGTK